MTQQDFITIVTTARKSRGWNQQQLADAAHTSKYTVCQFENGKANLSLNTLCDMLTALGVEVGIINRHREQVMKQVRELVGELGNVLQEA